MCFSEDACAEFVRQVPPSSACSEAFSQSLPRPAGSDLVCFSVVERPVGRVRLGSAGPWEIV
eukprot:12788670-Alexandrium_andersonii.AAC.1